MTPAEAQELGAQLGARAEPVTLQGEPHSAERIMFTHGVLQGHAACTCPVVDEHGQNVNPGRPMRERPHLRAARAIADEGNSRRRARKAADSLALIDPALWDDETKKIITTLATLAAPSRITSVLDAEIPPVDLTPTGQNRTEPEGVTAMVPRLFGWEESPLDYDERTAFPHANSPENVRPYLPVGRCPDHPHVAAMICGVAVCVRRRIDAGQDRTEPEEEEVHNGVVYTDSGEHPKRGCDCGPTYPGRHHPECNTFVERDRVHDNGDYRA